MGKKTLGEEVVETILRFEELQKAAGVPQEEIDERERKAILEWLKSLP